MLVTDSTQAAGVKWASGGGGSGVTSITAGTGLSGGTITTTGTIAIAAAGVNTTQLHDGAVTLAKMAAGSANSLLGYDNSGAAADVAVGSGLSLSAGTLTATSGGGTVTSVGTGTGLTGGPITGAARSRWQMAELGPRSSPRTQ